MRTLSFIILFASALIAKAQPSEQSTQKIGFADTDYILTQLPEFKKMDSELKTFYSQLENQMKSKYEEYQAKLKIYQTLPATTPDAIKADKERELAALQQSLEKFKEDAQTSYQKKQAGLLDPLYKKIGNAIEEVAKENGFAFIINPQIANAGQILMTRDEKFNISDLVLKKLGITPAPRQTLKID